MLKNYLLVFFVSMVPVVELRGAIPIGLGMGLPILPTYLVCVVGNMIPVPFIVVYIRRVFVWLRKHMEKMDRFITRLENKAHLKGETVKKYGPIALLLFVAIPLPGTGAWTGALVAALLDMRLKNSVPCIFLGVCIAATIMTLITFGVISVI